MPLGQSGLRLELGASEEIKVCSLTILSSGNYLDDIRVAYRLSASATVWGNGVLLLCHACLIRCVSSHEPATGWEKERAETEL